MFTKEHISDQIAFFSNPAALRVPAFRIMDRMSHIEATPGVQILATAVALRAMCESAGLDLTAVMTKAGKVMADADGPFVPHIQAIRDYAANEIRRGE